ncbi:unnamed protein product [Cuscuta europaea]|uniref:Reverse transcriptase Ty1/copia-type domain-containing protein n=2 Tax=Cuscuta europaea TaxID=41803 RepID=A0A9P0Z1P2_CUSEU|nr:unnamed protein product [Cuscuta europaea]
MHSPASPSQTDTTSHNSPHHPITRQPSPPVTRSKNHIFKPNPKYALHTLISSGLPIAPTTYKQAAAIPEWRQAMLDEFQALKKNHTWSLVPSTSTQNIIGCKWVFRVKQNPDGSIARYKARLVAKGFHQRPGVDFTDTFSPVVKPATVRVILTLAISQNWHIHQLDVNNAFLQGTLTDRVYMQQPQGFTDPMLPDHVCLLHKALYGLRQAPRAWYCELRTFLLQSGFQNSKSDVSLFTFTAHGSILFLLVYVDDIIITANNAPVLRSFITRLATRFSLKDLGALSYFLGLEAIRTSHGLHLTQHKYIRDLLSRTHMQDASPVPTPLSPDAPLSLSDGSSPHDATEYRSVIGALQYLSFTRPDISFVVNKLSQYMHRPTTRHWEAIKRVLRYLKGTPHFGIFISAHTPLTLHAYADADWAGDIDTRHSTSAYVVFLGRNPISWSSKKQSTVARSSTEAEYRAIASASAELTWLRNLLHELRITLKQSPTIFCDNISATYVCVNPVLHSRMKHVAIDFHFVREQIAQGLLRVSHVHTKDQLADSLTKPLARSLFLSHRSKLGILPGPLSLAGA